jgi:septum formation protein
MGSIDLFILASKSPDRKDMMERAGLAPFIVMPSDYAEKDQANQPARLAQIFATKKAQDVVDKFRNELKKAPFRESLPLPEGTSKATVVLIAADTLVGLKSEVIEKAEDENEAFRILMKLQGQTHKLITGFHLKILEITLDPPRVNETDSVTDVTTTHVKFSALSDTQIRAYIATGEWIGRAGCYAMQLRGSQFVKVIEGSPSGVVGLPVAEIVEKLRGLGLDI